jgi:ubiquinone/menaquinone biosynthesis C-methylase UbiE
MFTKTVAFYDAIYLARGKDYALESQEIHELIQKHKRSKGNTLLDLACGTGLHLQFFSRDYQCEGLDLDAEMLKVAGERCKKITLHQGNMIDFRIDKKFDAITCLFSSIGYVQSVENLHRTITTMSGHLQPGGVLVIEPWIYPERWKPGAVHSVFVDEPELKIARLNVSRTEDRRSILEMHYLVGTPQGINYFTELHEMGLFTHEEYLQAFYQNKLETIYDAKGLTGRGLYLGIKSL